MPGLTATPAPGQSEAPAQTDANAQAAALDAQVLFLNVGKADSALVRLGEKCFLVDAGTKDGAPELVARLSALGVTELEGMFLTHGHKDHIGGVEAVCRAIPTKRLYRSDIAGPESEKLVELSAKTGVGETLLPAGTTLEPVPGARIEILGPVAYYAEDENDNSLVMRLMVNQHTVLFAGDMQFAEEQSLLGAGADVSATVLKVGNHGNPDATSAEFARAVCAQVAVISTDTFRDEDSANPRVLRELNAAFGGAEVHITQADPYGILVRLDPTGPVAQGAAPPMEERAAELMNAERTRLVNRQNPVGEAFEPENLKKAEKLDIPNLTLKKDSIKADEEALYALRAMMTAAGAEGVTGFYLVSAYRTYEEQLGLWQNKLAGDPSYGEDESVPVSTAYPGASEHQTGLAFDVTAVDAKALSSAFAQTPQGKWLGENCARFGFVLRYPEGKEAVTGIVFEPWHLRFVGLEMAAYLFERGLTMEEFYQNFLKTGG